MEIKKITSFEVDHTTLREGMYISRVDGDITTLICVPAALMRGTIWIT